MAARPEELEAAAKFLADTFSSHSTGFGQVLTGLADEPANYEHMVPEQVPACMHFCSDLTQAKEMLSGSLLLFVGGFFGVTPVDDAVYEGSDGEWIVRVQFDLNSGIVHDVKLAHTAAGVLTISKVVYRCLSASQDDSRGRGAGIPWFVPAEGSDKAGVTGIWQCMVGCAPVYVKLPDANGAAMLKFEDWAVQRDKKVS